MSETTFYTYYLWHSAKWRLLAFLSCSVFFVVLSCFSEGRPCAVICCFVRVCNKAVALILNIVELLSVKYVIASEKCVIAYIYRNQARCLVSVMYTDQLKMHIF